MKKIFGMPILAIVIGLVVMGGAMAALVDYLSNSVSATATVDSPMEIKFWQGSDLVDDIVLDTVRGGSKVTMMLNERNYANEDINSILTIIISEPGVVNVCEEIEKLEFKGAESVNWHEIACQEANNNLLFELETEVPAGQNKNYDVAVTFNKYAKGTYTATIQHK